MTALCMQSARGGPATVSDSLKKSSLVLRGFTLFCMQFGVATLSNRLARALYSRPMTSTPSKARYVVLTFAVALAIITYVDRVAISVSLPSGMAKELGLSTIQQGWVLAAFAWAYALFEIPGGWLGDRIGPRRVLMRIVIWWSIFTAATGWAWSATSLIVTRALFGAGEAGAFPNLTRVFTTWLPVGERERAQATLWLATRLSGAFTPLLVATMITAFGWRRTFEIFGVLGVIWAVAFYSWFRDMPSEHPAVNQAELALLPPPRDTAIAHTGVPWGTIFSTPSVWLLSIQVHVPGVRVVVLHQLAADLPEDRARHLGEVRRAARRPAAAPRRARLPGLGGTDSPALAPARAASPRRAGSSLLPDSSARRRACSSSPASRIRSGR